MTHTFGINFSNKNVDYDYEFFFIIEFNRVNFIRKEYLVYFINAFIIMVTKILKSKTYLYLHIKVITLIMFSLNVAG